MSNGIVVLVGAGPGDPGLLTRAGADWLSRAEVVVYDNLADARLLALAPPSAERIHAGKSKGKCVLSQDEINRLLAVKAREGKTVVRLKGGDPFIFGRGAEEAEYLRGEGIAFRVVPGVTAGVGASAFAGIPLTHRGIASATAFVTGHHDPRSVDATTGKPRVDWDNLASFAGTVVVYMGLSRLEAIAQTLMEAGKPGETAAAVVASGSLPRQKTVTATLASIATEAARAGLESPALLIVGEVVRCRPSLNWFETGPLFGKRILVTRPAEEGRRSVARLEELGAEVILAPTVKIEPLEDFAPLDAAIARLPEFDWLVFTSSNGVAHFFDRLFTTGRDLRAVGHLKFAAIGPTTAEALSRLRLSTDLIPPSFRSESLAEELRPRVVGRKVLLARADRGRTLLKDELDGIAQVEQVAVYRNADEDAIPDVVVEAIERGGIDWITITSSAGVTRLHGLLGPAARERVGRETKLASISPVTSSAARALGWEPAAEATRHDWNGLLDALILAEEAG